MRKSAIIPGILVCLAALLASPAVRADKVDDLIAQLKSHPDYKVRLSAALNLGKLGDKRAIPALTDALSDQDKTVRGVAAAALGKLVDGTVEASVRNRAIGELERLASGDPDSFVNSQAQKTFDALKGLRTPPPSAHVAYVSIGPMADSTKSGSALVQAMRSTVEQTLAKAAPDFKSKWPSGAQPSAAELKKAGASGFWIDGTLTKLIIKKDGPTAQITCNVSVVVATFPEKSMFGFAKGGATVDTASDDQAIGQAKLDCVGAVLEDVVGRQVIPSIQAKLP